MSVTPAKYKQNLLQNISKWWTVEQQNMQDLQNMPLESTIPMMQTLNLQVVILLNAKYHGIYHRRCMYYALSTTRAPNQTIADGRIGFGAGKLQ